MRLILMFGLFLTSNIAISQNLIPNPSFEKYNACPNSWGQVYTVHDWFNMANHGGSVDYFNTCSKYSPCRAPENVWGYEYPASGNAYIGLVLIELNPSKEFREYVGVKLLCPLEMGVEYNVQYKYSLADKSQYSTNKFGISFTKDTIDGKNRFTAISSPLQITTNAQFDHKNGWTTMKGSFVAKGGEQFMYIGNFEPWLNTRVFKLDSGERDFCYVFLDDFSVTPKMEHWSLGPDTSLCDGKPMTLTLNIPNATYRWQDGSSDSFFTASKPGLYHVTVTSGCISFSDTIEIFNFKTPFVDFGPDSTLCENETLRLNVSPINGTYLWQDSSINSSFTVKDSGLYWVEISNMCGEAIDSIDIKYLSLPIVDLGSDTNLCDQTSFLIKPKKQEKLQWNDGSINENLVVKSSGLYSAMLSNQCGTNSDTIEIRLLETPVSQKIDTSICIGKDLLLKALPINSVYQWDDGETAQQRIINKTGNYSVVVTNACGQATINYSVKMDEPLAISLGQDTSMCNGGEIRFTGNSTNSRFWWQDYNTNPSYVVRKSGEYSVRVKNACGWFGDSINVSVIDCNCVPILPSAFTPNADGMNDIYNIVLPCGLTYYSIEIFNRWGEMVYKSNDEKLGWDGTFMNKQAKLGVYMYKIDYTLPNQVMEQMAGTFLLRR